MEYGTRSPIQEGLFGTRGESARFLQDGQAWLHFRGRNRSYVRKTKVGRYIRGLLDGLLI